MDPASKGRVDVTLELAKVVINSSSSKMFPLELDSSSRILSCMAPDLWPEMALPETIIKQWQNDEIKVLPSSRIRIDVKVLPQEPRTKSSRIAVSSRQSSISFNCALLWALSMIKFCRFFSTSGSSCYESHHTLW